jgi:hypothetical protein
MSAPKHEFQGIRPGDIGFDGGIGFSGWLIRTGTGSAHGHCFVYHTDLGDGIWETVEAGPSGLLYRKRVVGPNKVVRLWRDSLEQQAILRASAAMVGCEYGWGEIARIVCRILGIRLRKFRDNPRRVICSNHVAQVALAARPELVHYLRYDTNEVWPGELAITFDVMRWDQEVA